MYISTNSVDRTCWIYTYIYSTIITLIYFIKSVFVPDFLSFVLLGSIFTLLYTNLIILCKYSTIFLGKIIKKELLIQNEIYFLITSIVIFIRVGVVLTPMYDINQFTHSYGVYSWETFLSPISAYIFSLLLFSIGIFTSSHFSDFLQSGCITIFMWTNIIILCKYLSIFAQKIIRKEIITQKEVIFLFTSLLIFTTLGVMLPPVFYLI